MSVFVDPTTGPAECRAAGKKRAVVERKDKKKYIFTVISPELCSHVSKSDNSKQ